MFGDRTKKTTAHCHFGSGLELKHSSGTQTQKQLNKNHMPLSVCTPMYDPIHPYMLCSPLWSCIPPGPVCSCSPLYASVRTCVLPMVLYTPMCHLCLVILYTSIYCQGVDRYLYFFSKLYILNIFVAFL